MRISPLAGDRTYLSGPRGPEDGAHGPGGVACGAGTMSGTAPGIARSAAWATAAFPDWS
ncbi:hypothetical protein ACH4U7_11655 [Streptomyces sp. NPDC020845]|uniref:hypothetical protein n=1 Tax=Streptomyces sp. NPDC020845 TaxID=3365096 RepID=UPI0037A6B4EA